MRSSNSVNRSASTQRAHFAQSVRHRLRYKAMGHGPGFEPLALLVIGFTGTRRLRSWPFLLRNPLGVALISVGLWLISGAVMACGEQARNDMEHLYCDIRRSSPASVPFSLREFRANPPKTQRLLLARPAKKLGLSLPEVELSPGTDQKAPVRASQQRLAEEPSEANAMDGSSSVPTNLADCELMKRQILCKGERYRLILNNDRTSSGPKPGLGQGHFKAYGGDGSATSLNRYLAQSYEAYIDGMVGLGLAGNTLSYTKFVRLFELSRDNGSDFAQRMTTMFRHLHRDRQRLAVKDRYTDDRPESLAQCMPLGARYLVCDNVRLNWVYIKSE